jgi:hypothetical protein
VPEADDVAIDGSIKKAIANPTKEFFVTMITRDITLEDCILDLIDNSVDGAWRGAGSRPIGLAEAADLSNFSIAIEFSPEGFSIADNCGGMTLEDAINHAFSFGRRATEEHDDYSIGVYGIGMKRAVFKLGTDIKIRSTAPDNGNRLAFAVPINVADWLANDTPPWDFDIVEDAPLPEDGVEIVVKALTPGAMRSFESPAFLQNLRRTIARDYTLHLNRGLTISLNGERIPGAQIELRQSDEFAPMRDEYADEVDGEQVSVEMIVGMAAAPPDTSDPDEQNEAEKRFGWYVACNGRIVVAADKTVVSGWGTDGWPLWHPQYSGFLGIILFTAANAIALPLTTTKRSVDTSSEVFRRARPRMRDVTRKWIDYTNARKQALEEAKRREAQATSVSIYSVNKLASVRLPILTPSPAVQMANVLYVVELARLRKLGRALGNINMSYKDVGIQSFNYTYDELVGGE